MAHAPDAFRSVSTTAAVLAGGAMLLCACTLTTRVVDRIDEPSRPVVERSAEAAAPVESAEDSPELVVSGDALRWAPSFNRTRRANVRTVSIRHFRRTGDEPTPPIAISEPPVSAADESPQPTYDASGIGASGDATVTSLVASNDAVIAHPTSTGEQVVSVERSPSTQWRRRLDHVFYAGMAWKSRFDEYVAVDRRWTAGALLLALAGIVWLYWRIRKRRRRWFFSDLSG